MEQNTYTSQNKNILQNLTVGLIYPAVLGTFINTLFQMIISSDFSEKSGFFENTYFFMFIKIFLVLGVIGFYCCDFLYSVFTTNYKTQYFIFDIFILFGLSVTFRAIHIDSKDLPDLCCIILLFIAFMASYLIWDLFKMGNTETRAGVSEKKFYDDLFKWEWKSLLVLVVIFIIYLFINTLYNLSFFLTTIIIIWITVQFTTLIRAQRNLLPNSTTDTISKTAANIT